MKTPFRLVIILAGLLQCHLVTAQTSLRFDRLGSENIRIEKGLSQNTVNCIHQDSRGYMWFGTWDGLNMFDGYDFTIFKPDLYGSEGGLSNQTITSMLEDRNGVLWIGTENGLNRFDRHTRTFTSYVRNGPHPSGLSSDTINYLLQDKHGDLWIATDYGLCRKDLVTGAVTTYLPEPGNAGSLGNGIVRWLYEDPNGHIWAATRGGLSILNPITGRFRQIRKKSGKTDWLQADTIHCIASGPEGLVWLGTEKGLEVYDPAAQTFNHIPGIYDTLLRSPLPVNIVFTDAQGVLWAGTEGGGLRRYYPDYTRFSSFRFEPDNPGSISDDYISTIYQDKSGIIWIGTKWKGANKISDNAGRFDHFYHKSDDHNSLNSNLVWSFHEDPDGKLWIATDLGINIWDRKTGKFQFLRHEPHRTNSLISDKISVISKDSKGYFWFGSFDKGACRYDPVQHQFLDFSMTSPATRRLPDNDIGSIIEDRKGNIWIGTGDGLVRVDPRTYQTFLIPQNAGSPSSMSHQNITSIYEDKAGFIWIGTYRSLERYDPSTGLFTAFRHDAMISSSISSDAVFCMFEDRQRRFWIGTRGGGLNRMDRSNGTFITYTESEGLPNNVVYAILEDEEGNLWMSTNYGLSVFDPDKETFVNFDVRDGLQSNEFNLGAAHRSHSGEMFFGGMAGFNAFFPERIRNNLIIPQLVISEFQIFNQRLPRDLKNGDTIRLNYDENTFTILFSALDFTNPMRNLYSYTLDKIDKGWINTDGSKRFAEYTRVPPGSYTFRLKGSNNDGIWNENPFTLTIIISPPWYATWVFRIFVFLAATGLLISAIWLRFRRIDKRHRMETRVLAFEKQLIDIRQKALRLQMNPHFIFNSLNSIQSFVLNNDTDKAIHYLAKFSQLMRQILTNSNETFVPLSEELKALVYYMEIEQLRFDNKFTFEIHTPAGLEAEFVEIPPMIIQPYIENAIIHGLINKQENGKIDIRVEMQGDILHWEIEDNGIGREASRALRDGFSLHRKSRGMMITRQRLEILNTGPDQRYGVQVVDLKAESGNAAGTKVIINMPVRET